MTARQLPSAVLFACTMNSVRSPLAAAITRQIYGQAMFVRSAGVHAGEADGFAAEVAREIGIDLTHRASHTFAGLQDGYFDVVIALSPEAHAFAQEWARTVACIVEYWPTPDPTLTEGSRDAKLAAYRELRDLLRARIQARFGTLP